jgi:hypothetical protein
MEVIGQFNVPARFPPGEIAPSTHWVGDWVGPRSGLDAVQNRKIVASAGNQAPGHLAPNSSTYRQIHKPNARKPWKNESLWDYT